MTWVVCAVIAAATLGFTLFVRDKDIPAPATEDPARRDLEIRKSVVYENLRDLQFEYRQGKLSDADYQTLKTGFQVELAGIMDAIDHLQAPPTAATANSRKPSSAQKANNAVTEKSAPPAKATAVAAAIYCTSCGAEASRASKFCGECGKPLQP